MTAVATLAWLLPAGAVAGLVGAVAMDLPMARQPEGWTPAVVAASVLRRTEPESVRFRDANVVHHAAGIAAGVLYAVLAAPLAVVFAGTPATPGAPSLPVVAHLGAVFGVVVFIYAFFTYLVLPRAGSTIADDRTTAVRGQWFRSALVFGTALTVVIPVAGLAVA